MTFVYRIVIAAVLLPAVAACNGTETPTSSTNTSTTTTTIVASTVTEEFGGTLQVGASSFYSFTVEQNGTVGITLASVGGANVPASIWLGLGIGAPSAEDCSTTSTVNTQSGSSAQISGTYTAGIYCAKVFDIGNLVAPARFTVTIEHP